MKLWMRLLIAGSLAVLAVGLCLPWAARASGLPVEDWTLFYQQTTPPKDGEYHRKTNILTPYTLYDWWLIRWSNNAIKCTIRIEHEGLPTSDEVLTACGESLHREWINTTPCANLDSCSGLYLHLVGLRPMQRLVEVELPTAKVWLSITGCDLQPPENLCSSMPNLLFSGEEPLPNESIIRIQGTLNGEPFSCPGGECSIPLQPTGMQGATIEFWADSSFGDSSLHHTAQVRVVPWGNFMAPEGATNDPQAWYVDIISSQWRGGKLASCSDVWKVFPEVGGPPAWLTSPDRVEALSSSRMLYYLAGMLISNGYVDASACPANGLQAPRVANGCGVVTARPAVQEWQNRFDSEILQVSQDTGVPAQLMKNVFYRESQFWPGTYRSYREAGLGQLTENGADTVLLWNPDFFTQFCPLVLSKEVCQLGFGNLTAEEQTMLRGAVVKQVNASCPECPIGLDLRQASFSVNVFADSMLANCEQVGRMIYNVTGQSAGEVSSYTDLWKFTLTNYNAGAGCLVRAINTSWNLGESLNWENVSAHLEPVCQGVNDYIADVSGIPRARPTPTPALQPSTPVPSLPPEFDSTPLPTQQGSSPQQPTPPAQPTPTQSTEEPYPYPPVETEPPY